MASMRTLVGTPRCLLIDLTAFGGRTATGELKASYFAGFGKDRLLHLCAGPPGKLRLAYGGALTSVAASLFDPDSVALADRCRIFDPDVVLYRPVAERPELHRAAMRLIRELGRPWIIWVMDDWPERLRVAEPRRFESVDRDLRELLRGASDRFAISNAMADAFRERYGVPFNVFHNGVRPDDWPKRRIRSRRWRRVLIRYAGGLAPDMQRNSVLEIARAVEQLSRRHRVRFEIRTQQWWLEAVKEDYEGLAATSIEVSDMTDRAYRAWLKRADIVVIAYNFDEATTRYVRYSFANKMPEYMASGAAIFAYGPREIATIAFLASAGGALVVDERSTARLERELEHLIRASSLRASLANAARSIAFSQFDRDHQRASFIEALHRASCSGSRVFVQSDRAAHEKVPIDERSVIVRAMKRWTRLGRRPIILGAVVLAAALVAAAAATHSLPESWLGSLSPTVLFHSIAANLLFSALVSGAVYVYLKSRLKSSRRSIHSRLDTLTEQLKQRIETEERMAKLISVLEGRVAGLFQAISALNVRVTGHSLTMSRLNASNAARARPHTRLLKDAALARLEKHWAPLFGLRFRPTALAYLAHQLCLAEDRCEGRLDTSIETAMLRLLALRSLKRSEVDLIEIRTLFGLGAGLLHRFRGDGISRLRLTLVDPLNGYYGAGEVDPITGMVVGEDTLMRNMGALDVPEEDVFLSKGLSTETDIIGAAKRRTYDFALIHGDHSGRSVRHDFETYGPLIRPGGLVLFDDYDAKEWPEIKPAVDDLMESAGGWEWVGADWGTGIARRLSVGSR